jgi:hypothetical protein
MSFSMASEHQIVIGTYCPVFGIELLRDGDSILLCNSCVQMSALNILNMEALPLPKTLVFSTRIQGV